MEFLMPRALSRNEGLDESAGVCRLTTARASSMSKIWM